MYDHDLNYKICSMWVFHYRGDKRLPNHATKSFAFVNNMLQDRDCHLYKKYGEKKFKRAYSSSKSSSDCSDQGTEHSALDKRSGMKRKLQEDWEEQNKPKD